jgi:hypothetical protein
MKSRTIALIPVFAAMVMAAPTWKTLFDVNTYRKDWHYVGDSTFWTVDPKDTSIDGFSATSNTPHSLLFTNRTDYDQFTVKYSYRLKNGCSGFWFHSHEKGTATTVDGPQVEIKREGKELLEIGSIYTWGNNTASPGWEVQHSHDYSVRTAPNVDDYQNVILTVKKPYIYVNVNGSQAIGETDAAALAAGAKAAWNYSNSTYAKNPGSFALQVHEGYAIDVRFKNVMILQGCNDPKSPNYGGDFVPGFPKQPAVYQDDGSACSTSSLNGRVNGLAKAKPASYLGAPQRFGDGVSLTVSYPGPNSLEVLALDGRSLFSGSAPSAFSYRLSPRTQSGLYFVKITTGGRTGWQRVLVP